MNVFELLGERSRFEEIVLNYKIPGNRKAGTLSNLKWFMKNAGQKNSKKEGYQEAYDIADRILQNVKGWKKSSK